VIFFLDHLCFIYIDESVEDSMLLRHFLEIVLAWRDVFPQARTHRRSMRQALGSLVCLGRCTLSRIIWVNGGQDRSWSAEYFLHERCRWDEQQLFTPILERALSYCSGRYVAVAVDDTRLRKTGRAIPHVFYQRDPLSPPFHVNLMLGLRFLQASLLLPLHRQANTSARALPIRFQEVSVVKRPGRKAPKEQWKQYRAAVKKHNLSQSMVAMMGSIREVLDVSGARRKKLLLVADGSFANRTVFTAVLPRVETIARCRKDARLCFPAPEGSRRFYGVEKFTPEQVRKDDSIPWRKAKLWYGGKRRKLRYKDVTRVYWQGGARRLPLRLLVLAPTPYRKPAYLLTTLLKDNVRTLVQAYLDRWQIEVNHREEKDTLGVGQAQMWNVNAVPRQPALSVAAYSALLLASLKAFGTERGSAYAPLPKWRRHAKRPSCLDLVTLLRKEMVEHPKMLASLGLNPSYKALTSSAAA
jgi:hypothetical protein